MPGLCKIFLKKIRPIRPNPLIAILIAAVYKVTKLTKINDGGYGMVYPGAVFTNP
jgi:hypothetical protein